MIHKLVDQKREHHEAEAVGDLEHKTGETKTDPKGQVGNGPPSPGDVLVILLPDKIRETCCLFGRARIVVVIREHGRDIVEEQNDEEKEQPVELVNKTTMKVNGQEYDISNLHVPDEFIQHIQNKGQTGGDDETHSI